MNLRVLELQKKIRRASCYSVLSGVSSRQILTGRIIYDVPLEGESTKLNPSASPFRLFLFGNSSKLDFLQTKKPSLRAALVLLWEQQDYSHEPSRLRIAKENPPGFALTVFHFLSIAQTSLAMFRK
jgi:hypothetical protein